MGIVLGENIKRARLLKKWTQRELADALGMSAGAVANYESGLRDPDSEMIVTVANVLGVTTDWLLGRMVSDSRGEYLTPTGDIILDRTRRKLLRELDRAGKTASLEDLKALTRLAESIVKNEDNKAEVLLRNEQNSETLTLAAADGAKDLPPETSEQVTSYIEKKRGERRAKKNT